MKKPIVAFIVGTRPDAIKTLPVVRAMKQRSEVETLLISTGQHREMLAQVFNTFGLHPEVDLELMKHGQSLSELTGRMSIELGKVLEEKRPKYLLAQGDTTTTFVASLSAFYAQVRFGHIEAGLRTHDIRDPFPEEFNRRAAALITHDHFAPTELSASNLLKEGVPKERILVTGNTGIDAVLSVAAREPQTWFPDHPGRIALMTMHRRENWGEPMAQAARAVLRLVNETPDLLLVVAMHRNPAVREVLEDELGEHPRIHLIEPPEYAQFAKLIERSTIIFTDSGGVQEEAPSFGKPILVLRQTTERPEGVDAGCARLVGTDPGEIYRWGHALLTDLALYHQMAKTSSPYGDGDASSRIVERVLQSVTST